MYYHHGQIKMFRFWFFTFTCYLEEHLLTFFVQKQQSCFLYAVPSTNTFFHLSWFELTMCTNNVCEINFCLGTFRWEVGIYIVSSTKNWVHRPCPPVINCGKSWLTNSHIQQRGSRCGLINGVVHFGLLLCSNEAALLLFPKKWLQLCPVNIAVGTTIALLIYFVSHWALLVLVDK